MLPWCSIHRVGGIHHRLKHPPAHCIVLHTRPGAHCQARLVDHEHERRHHRHGREHRGPASVGAHGRGGDYEPEDARVRQRDAVEQVVGPGVLQGRARHRHEEEDEAPDPDEGADAAPQQEKLALAKVDGRVEKEREVGSSCCSGPGIVRARPQITSVLIQQFCSLLHPLFG
jgi:hypothetical protein